MIRPELTVAAVIQGNAGLDQDPDSFLVVEETVRGKLVLNQPAGHIEQDETPLEAVVREVREETAWGFTVDAMIGIYLWRSPRTEDYIMRTAFCGTATDFDSSLELDTGIHAAHWMTRDALLKSERLRSPFVLRCIDDYLGGRRASLETVTLFG